MLCFFRFYPPPLGSAHPLHLHFSLLKVLMLYYWCFPFSFNTTTHAHTPSLICKALNKELLRANFNLFDCMMQQRLPGIIVKYCCVVFFCLSDPLSNSKNQGFFLEAKLVRFLSCKSCFWGHAGLTLSSLSLQCPVSLHRTCERSLWRPTRQWSHGQSLHGWHCTVCWKATGLCFGPSSPMEVGAVGARPSGQCRVIITYLILNFSNNQPTSPTHPTTTYLPTYLPVCQCCESQNVCVYLHLSHEAPPVPVPLEMCSCLSLFLLFPNYLVQLLIVDEMTVV